MQPSDDKLIAQAQRVCNVYAKVLNTKFGCNIPIPVPMAFNLEDTLPKAAGRAHSTLQVDVNMVLYRDNISHILNDTLPHEMGHLGVFEVFRAVDTSGHGPEWREMMRRLGKEPHKFHTLDTTKAVAHFKSRKKKKAS